MSLYSQTTASEDQSDSDSKVEVPTEAPTAMVIALIASESQTLACPNSIPTLSSKYSQFSVSAEVAARESDSSFRSLREKKQRSAIARPSTYPPQSVKPSKSGFKWVAPKAPASPKPESAERTGRQLGKLLHLNTLERNEALVKEIEEWFEVSCQR